MKRINTNNLNDETIRDAVHIYSHLKYKEPLEAEYEYVPSEILNIEDWNVARVRDMSGLFENLEMFDENISSWVTTNVTNMSKMFYKCTQFNKRVGFDTSSVLDMSQMFCDCLHFNKYIWFDTTNVTNMGGMFQNCISFDSLVDFDTSSVENMESMFFNCTSFNKLLDFNTENVVNTNNMFRGCSSFTQNISFWNLRKCLNHADMFYDCPISELNKPLFRMPRDKISYYDMKYNGKEKANVNKKENIEVRRKKQSHSFSSQVGRGEISKISFVCICHGASMTTFEELDPTRNYKKTTQVSDHVIPSRTTDVIFKKSTPPLKLQYRDIDTKNLNVFLSTSETCLGATVRLYTHEILQVRQKLLNDIMEEITHTCPTTDIFDVTPYYGKIHHTTRKTYSERNEMASRTIQRKYRKKKNKTYKMEVTEFMKHDNDKVDTILDKIYTLEYGEINGFLTERSDSGKLVMIITRNTLSGCTSEKYVLLSTMDDVIRSIQKLYKDLTQPIADFALSILQTQTHIIDGKEINLPSVTLHGLLMLAYFIIEQREGIEATKRIPIHIYDLTCNNFFSTPSHYSHNKTDALLNEQELSIMRMFNKHLRDNDIAYGGQSLKKR